MELVDIAQRQKPMSDGVRRTRWAVVRNCYDDQTEILTEKRGFQLFKDLDPTDRLATIQNGNIKYEQFEAISVFPYKGEMIGFDGENVDFLVTPDHELWISKRRTRKKIWGEYERVKAESIYGNQLVRMKKNAKWEAPEHRLLNKSHFEYLGFWFAEGSENRGDLILTHIKDAYTEKLFSRVKLRHKETKKGKCSNFWLRDTSPEAEEIKRICRGSGKAINKVIPSDIMAASRKNIIGFLDGFEAGDGNIYNGTRRLYTSSKKMANQLQELALKAGFSANLKSRNRVGKRVEINGHVGQVNSVEWIVTLLCENKQEPILFKQRGKYIGWYKTEYDGFVYCAQMKFPCVYTRRNGKTSINTRTYPQLNDTTIKTFQYWFPPTFTGSFRTTDHRQVIDKIYTEDGIPTEIEILFRALDKPEHVDNLLSLELTGAWFNELREIPKAIWEAMSGRVGRFPPKNDGGCTWSGIFADTNPPDSDHWAYKLFEEEQPWMCNICGFPFNKELQLCTNGGHVIKGEPPCGSKSGKPATAIFHQPSGRGPFAENLRNLDNHYYPKLMTGKSQSFIKVYVDGEYGYVSDGRPVYDNWSHVLHVAPGPLKANKNYPMIISFDFGQGACVLLQNLPTGNLNVLHEFFHEGGTIGVERLIRDIVKPYIFANYLGMKFFVTGDPAGTARSQVDERTCYMEIQKQAITSRDSVRPAYTNAWTPRFDSVDKWLTKWSRSSNGDKVMPSFQVDPSCRMLIKGFDGKYRFKRIQVSDDERFQDKAEKNKYSHVHDALHYGCMFVEHGMEMVNQRIYYTPTPAPSPLAWT